MTVAEDRLLLSSGRSHYHPYPPYGPRFGLAKGYGRLAGWRRGEFPCKAIVAWAFLFLSKFHAWTWYSMGPLAGARYQLCRLAIGKLQRAVMVTRLELPRWRAAVKTNIRRISAANDNAAALGM